LVFLARVATDTVVQELYSSSSGVSPFLEMAPKGSPSFFVVRASTGHAFFTFYFSTYSHGENRVVLPPFLFTYYH
jgi:hypothetical protein